MTISVNSIYKRTIIILSIFLVLSIGLNIYQSQLPPKEITVIKEVVTEVPIAMTEPAITVGFKSDWEKELYSLHFKANPKLKRNIALEVATCNRANYIYSSGENNHNKFQEQWEQWLGAFYNNGENLGKGYSSPQDLFNAWLNSEGHKRNIINGSYHLLGICKVGNITVVWFSNSILSN